MTPYSILYCNSDRIAPTGHAFVFAEHFILSLLLMMLAPGLPCHGSLIFLVTAVFFFPLSRSGLPRMVHHQYLGWYTSL